MVEKNQKFTPQSDKDTSPSPNQQQKLFHGVINKYRTKYNYQNSISNMSITNNSISISTSNIF